LKLASEEVFGPVALLEEYEDFETALRIVNESRYGLQAGVFTRDIGRALRAYRELEVGGVVLNNVPSLRVDSMPYGGVKDSGVGREGVRSMIAELTEPKTLLFNGGESPR
jgi:acyl-CoA reductase-like NAD-dependent aldehyde dehydrogenase